MTTMRSENHTPRPFAKAMLVLGRIAAHVGTFLPRGFEAFSEHEANYKSYISRYRPFVLDAERAERGIPDSVSSLMDRSSMRFHDPREC